MLPPEICTPFIARLLKKRPAIVEGACALTAPSVVILQFSIVTPPMSLQHDAVVVPIPHPEFAFTHSG